MVAGSGRNPPGLFHRPMGSLLRLTVFVLVLGLLAGGMGVLLLQERNREHKLERLLAGVSGGEGTVASEGESEEEAAGTAGRAELLKVLRAKHATTQRGIVIFGALAIACATLLVLVPARGRAPADEGAPAVAAARSEMRGMESLARATVAQRAELDSEREARHRTEEDLHLQQLLTNRVLQDKIRLGRDLHDGLVQSLYATGLLIDAANQLLAAEPPRLAEANRLVDQAKNTLNNAIREARQTIGGLKPDAVETQSLGEALHSLLDHLDGQGRVARHVELHPELPALDGETRLELLQIIREATSNALRHAEATRLEIALAPHATGVLRLVVQDDGRGFDIAAVTRGHGLDNLAARARQLGGELAIDSAPGRGTTLTVAFVRREPGET